MTNPNPKTRRQGYDYPLRDTFKQALMTKKNYSEVVAYSMATCIVNTKCSKHKQARILWTEVMDGASFPPLLGEYAAAAESQIPLPSSNTGEAPMPQPLTEADYIEDLQSVLSFVADVLALRGGTADPAKDSLLLDLIAQRIGRKKAK
jgi:hypothetical protein